MLNAETVINFGLAVAIGRFVSDLAFYYVTGTARGFSGGDD